MSLRDNSTMCFRDILTCLSGFHGNSSLFKLVVIDNMLPLIKTGIRHKTEVCMLLASNNGVSLSSQKSKSSQKYFIIVCRLTLCNHFVCK